jgi:hypothetical protein
MEEFCSIAENMTEEFGLLYRAAGNLSETLGTLLEIEEDPDGRAVLSGKEAEDIRLAYSKGNCTHRSLARDYDVSTFTISQVIHRRGHYS